MLNDDDLKARLHGFMDREFGRSRPTTVEGVQARAARRRGLNRLAIVAVAVSLFVIVGATLAVVRQRRAGEVSAQSDTRVTIAILPGSGSQWIAFALHNNMTTNVGYGLVGAVDHQSGSSWKQVRYFEASPIGGTRPGTLSHDEPSAVHAVELVATARALGSIQWIDVSSLPPGTYRLRETVELIGESLPSTGKPHAIATGEFEIHKGGPAQAPPLESAARIEPGLPVVDGAQTPLALELVGGTGDLASDTRIEQSLSLTVHIRRWQLGKWAEIATRQATRLHGTFSTISAPRLTPGLYELARAKPSGGEIDGWLFVTTNITGTSPTRLQCRVSLGTKSTAVLVKIARNAHGSAVIEGFTEKFTIVNIPTRGTGFMTADLTGPTLDKATHVEGAFSTQTDAFKGRIATPAGHLGYVCGV